MLIGREQEASKLLSLLTAKGNSPLSIYISGAPGTGKTATTKAVLQMVAKNKKVKYIHINCVGINKKTDIEKTILTELESLPSKQSSYGTELLNAFTTTKKKIIIVLDEIDHLNSRKNSLLYSAFGWPKQSNGQVIVIGIANSLDLTKRLLPKLEELDGLVPEVFSFEPYTSQQIINILQEHLSTVRSLKIFNVKQNRF
jgi:cell division control protein 6